MKILTVFVAALSAFIGGTYGGDFSDLFWS